MSDRTYCVIALYPVGGDRPSLLASGGRPIVFDTIHNARDVMPMLGNHRPMVWNEKQDVATWTVVEPGVPSRAVIIEDYDPYNAPAQVNVKSEMKNMAWKHHVHWTEVWHAQRQRIGR